MSALLSKALILARGHARRLLRGAAAPPAPPARGADVLRFEVPPVPAAFANATRQQLVDWYWQRHPRFVFFKGLPPGARLLDVGAGSGGIAFWREYMEPRRTDIALYGVDLAAPPTRSLYAGFEVGNLDHGFPFEGQSFDAVFASHVLEHVESPARTLADMASRLRAGGRAYIEMPTPESKLFPTAHEYRARGWPMMISNFHDDATHRETLGMQELIAIAAREGLSCMESGIVSAPSIDDALVAQGFAWRDEEIMLYGFWSKTRWAHYAVFERIAKPAHPKAVDYAPPAMEGIAPGLRLGRNVREGYARGWGLEFGDLAERVAADPLYREAVDISAGRSCMDERRRMNLFLLLKFYLAALPGGNIIEFGAYKGGNAIFMAHVARRLLPGVQVLALDTFQGMPATDAAVDAHSAGDFGDADLEGLRKYVAECGLDNLQLVQGRLEDTVAGVISSAGPFRLAHIDTDIYSAVANAYDAIRSAMVPGGYLVFDDATVSSCIGATEAVETLVIRRDGLASEQIYPHFVFRAPPNG